MLCTGLMGWMAMVFVSVCSLPVASTSGCVQSNTRTMLLYMTDSTSQHTRQQIRELQQEFGEDMRVVWGNEHEPQCPYDHCIDQWPISKTRKLSHFCCGQEYAITWAIDNRHMFEHVWFMEDDVHYTDIEALRMVLRDSKYSQADTVTQEGKYSVKDWFYEDESKQAIEEWLGPAMLDDHPEVLQHSMMNFYRLSRKFLGKLGEVYHQNDEEWLFFEALFPTVSNVYNMSWYTFSRPEFSMEHRPCKTEFLESGIYHPVKFHLGEPFACECYEDAFRKNCKKQPAARGCQMCKKLYWDTAVYRQEMDAA